MRINLAKSAGFCFGVRRALTIALETAQKGRPAYMLGDIVHNEDVVRRIKMAGIKKISSLGNGRNRILLIRAHGTDKETFKQAKEAGYTIVDATCPMVKQIHRIAQEMERKNYRIIIIGDENHEEVRGIIGQLKHKALVIDDSLGLPLRTLLTIRKACIVVQSTQNLAKVSGIVTRLKTYIRDIRFFNTVCKPTRMKQEEIKQMPLHNDVMVIIGSKASANTRRLFEIAKSLNPRTHWVQRAPDLRPGWFRQAKSVGVTSGASTPDETTQAVIKRLRSIKL